ncbi:MAG: hypothetical protein M1840_005093 [Geoglossum simile]|nr:MAG: hypothetical protein M1840_005093 [Geoglossum simile]
MATREEDQWIFIDVNVAIGFKGNEIDSSFEDVSWSTVLAEAGLWAGLTTDSRALVSAKQSLLTPERARDDIAGNSAGQFAPFSMGAAPPALLCTRWARVTASLSTSAVFATHFARTVTGSAWLVGMACLATDVRASSVHPPAWIIAGAVVGFHGSIVPILSARPARFAARVPTREESAAWKITLDTANVRVARYRGLVATAWDCSLHGRQAFLASKIFRPTAFHLRYVPTRKQRR